MEIEYKDAKGCVIQGKKYGDLMVTKHFIGNVKDHVHDIRCMECRKDDVFIITYPKSGTHWMFEIVQMLQRGNTEYFKEVINVLEFLTKEELSAIKSPRTITGHLNLRYLPQEAKISKVIYIRRNPKDVAVSMYSMYRNLSPSLMDYKGEWQDFLPMYLDGNVPYGSWFDYELDWQNEIANNKKCDIFPIEYEHMKKDLKGSVRKIADFLEVQYDDDLINDIARKCEFKSMSDEKNKNIAEGMKGVFTTGKNAMYRKGEIGDWKNWFTVAQNEYFDSVYNEKMKASCVKIQFE